MSKVLTKNESVGCMYIGLFILLIGFIIGNGVITKDRAGVYVDQYTVDAVIGGEDTYYVVLNPVNYERHFSSTVSFETTEQLSNEIKAGDICTFMWTQDHLFSDTLLVGADCEGESDEAG